MAMRIQLFRSICVSYVYTGSDKTEQEASYSSIWCALPNGYIPPSQRLPVTKFNSLLSIWVFRTHYVSVEANDADYIRLLWKLVRGYRFAPIVFGRFRAVIPSLRMFGVRIRRFPIASHSISILTPLLYYMHGIGAMNTCVYYSLSASSHGMFIFIGKGIL